MKPNQNAIYVLSEFEEEGRAKNTPTSAEIVELDFATLAQVGGATRRPNGPDYIG